MILDIICSVHLVSIDFEVKELVLWFLHMRQHSAALCAAEPHYKYY